MGLDLNFTDVGAVKRILHDCRKRDRDELDALYGVRFAIDTCPQWLPQACLLEIFETVKHGYIKEPVAFVAAHKRTPSTVELSMIATDDWPLVAPRVIKWAKRVAMPSLLEMGFRRAEVRSIEGHPEAQRFLEHLGFEIEGFCGEYGRNGENFWQYSWRSRDHSDVLHGNTTSSSPAPRAAA